LKEQVSKSNDKNSKSLWQELEQHLKVFTDEHDFKEDKIKADVNKGRDLVEKIGDRQALTNVTSAK